MSSNNESPRRGPPLSESGPGSLASESEEMAREASRRRSNQPRCYSYENLAGPLYESTCGQAAMATVLDWFGLNPFGLPRVARGQGDADDGRLHFDNSAFVGELTRRYPPLELNTPWGRIRLTLREDLARALDDFGLKCEQRWPRAFSSGEEAREELVDWLQRTGNPVITLLDIPKMWPQQSPYTLHWGVIYSCGQDGVAMASWHQTFGIPWNMFMRAWHCEGLPHPNNFLQIRVWK
jgi:hypothetical protein